MAAKRDLDVYVKLPTGRNSQYYLEPTATIRTVCERVAREEQVAEELVRIKYQGKILNKSLSLAYLGVRAETILKAEIVTPQLLNLVVQFPDGRTEEYAMQNTKSFRHLQDKIAEAECASLANVVLKSEGRQLAGVSLMDVGVRDGSVICVEIKEVNSEISEGATSLSEALDPKQLCEIMSSFDNGGRRVEVVFSFDTTGSMYGCLNEVRQKLRETCSRLLTDIPSIRIGLMAHGDYCDHEYQYVLRSIDLTAEVQRLVSFAKDVPQTGGGDAPECYEWVLRKAQQLDWSEDSAKALVVIGDAEPHPPSYTDQNINWRDELDLLTGMGVKVYGVNAGRTGHAVHFYKELAERSGGCFLELRHLDVITDMFLAVCYRESNDDQLDAFEREIEEKGEMTEDKKEMFKQLEEKSSPETEAKTKDNYVPEAWWDLTRDTGPPQYSYLADSDQWVDYEAPASSCMPTFVSAPALSSTGSKKKYKRKKACVVM
ncbi:uncharacterized protein LOC124288578 [Haliotis rubra]|uniref:uncharacterized protein LOC124288578 n=1 Tax=Haliotis rubra TaxID=36100 RepID=UPI001EE62EAC|nr:uncharacterized protein LOC124288578 [Haliotis rubra]